MSKYDYELSKCAWQLFTFFCQSGCVGYLINISFHFVAVLAAGAPDKVAFMADETMSMLPGLQPIKYDLSFFKKYMTEISALVKKLNKGGMACSP